MYAKIMTENGFESPWYWLFVALIWVRACHWTFGVSHEIMREALNGNAQAKTDVLSLVDIHVRNAVTDFQRFGTFFVLLVCFVLTAITTMGFLNDILMLQAVFFFALPMAIIGGLGLRIVFKMHQKPLDWDGFCRVYKKNRRFKFFLGLLFILLSMAWKLYLEIRPYLQDF
ncbi:MAG: hypothetical protein COB84_05465 [Rhodobacteraceae bacterium]|nr:MAG: hypothetical protein COB84_05465 [Paracoccaceae bacterium]